MAKRRGRSRRADAPSASTTVAEAAGKYLKALKTLPKGSSLLAKESDIEVLPLGLPSVDWGVLGIGGLPFNRAVEIFGKQGSGKTKFCIRACAQFHKHYKGDVLWCDPEGSHLPSWFEKGGMDLERTLIAHSLGFGENYVNMIYAALASGVRLVIVDSVAALTPKMVVDADRPDLKMNEKMAHAMMMTTFLAQLESGNATSGRPALASSDALVIFINHTSSFKKEDQYYDDSKGAVKLKFVCRMRLNIEMMKIIRDNKGDTIFKPPAGQGVARVQCLKNQHAPPMGESTVHLNLRSGGMWDDIDSIIAMGKLNGTLDVGAGGHYTYKKMKWHGKDAFEDTVSKLPGLAERICNPNYSPYYIRPRTRR